MAGRQGQLPTVLPPGSRSFGFSPGAWAGPVVCFPPIEYGGRDFIFMLRLIRWQGSCSGRLDGSLPRWPSACSEPFDRTGSAWGLLSSLALRSEALGRERGPAPAAPPGRCPCCPPRARAPFLRPRYIQPRPPVWHLRFSGCWRLIPATFPDACLGLPGGVPSWTDELETRPRGLSA